jgi:hypothetical protein
MKTTITIFILLLNTYFINAQVGIDNTNPQAALDITSTNDGLLIPRVALTNTITATVITPTTSELVYNTATSGTAPNNVIPGFYYWDGTKWVSIKNTTTPSSSGWSLTGNSATVDGTNFLGTIDDVPFTIKVNNQKAGRISSTGQTFFGYQAGNVNTNDSNTGIGFYALNSNTIGGFNTAIGVGALSNNTIGNYNSAIGGASLNKNTTGNNNTANGSLSLNFNTTGNHNTANGSEALYSNTTGNYNNTNGSRSLYYNTTGYANNAIGFESLFNNWTGYSNVANGDSALHTNINGYQNTAIGAESLYSNANANQNTANGYRALFYNSSGNGNSAIGNQALFNNISGNYNTALGTSAGGGNNVNMAGNYNTFLGYNSASDITNRTNCIAIAGNSNLAFGGDNRVRIGNNSMTSIGGQVTWTTISDERVKENIQNDVKGLDFILKLKPVTYNYSIEKSNKVQNYAIKEDWESKYNIEKIRFSGFLAQEVKRTAQEVGYDFSGVDKPEDAYGLWGLRYAEFTVPLVKSVQELHEKNLAIQTENQHLQNQVADLLKRMELQEQTIKTMQSNLNSLNSKK